MSGGPDEVVTGPPGTRFRAVHRFEETDSTNGYLAELARTGAPDGTVAVARYQHAGRGRLGRRWEAPPGSNLLVSVLLRLAVAVDELHLCSAALALAAADACRTAAGVDPGLKWPNDLVVGERKLAGILAETLAAHATGPLGARVPETAVVVGLGLNVGWPPPEGAPGGGTGAPGGAPGDDDDLLRTATSLAREVGLVPVPGPDDLLDAVLGALEPRLVELHSAEGRRHLASEYRRRCATLGRRVRVTTHHEVFTGLAAALTPEGHLIVDTGRSSRTVAVGDVVHLRAASGQVEGLG